MTPNHGDAAGAPLADRSGSATGNLPGEDDRGFYLLAQTDPAQAVMMAQSLDPAQRSSGLLENLVEQWSAADLPAASAWVEQATAGDERDRLLGRIAFTVARADPAEAATLVATLISPGPRREESAIMVLHQWMQKDLAAAQTWTSSLPGGPLRTRAENELAGWVSSEQELGRD
jgi:hypothetical protein